MKRAIILLILSAAMLVSCAGNASLWGQYATPTAFGAVPPTSSPAPEIIPTNTPVPVDPLTFNITTTYTPTVMSDAFVTQAATTVIDTPTLATEGKSILYYSQNGDWLPAVAKRFGVEVSEITSPKILPDQGFLDAGTLLIIPDRRENGVEFTQSLQLLPDSEFIFSSTALDFDITSYVKEAGGYLSTYREYLGSTGWTSGAGVIERAAYENSVNPRLLLAVLDYESHWVRGKPENQFRTEYPMGYENFRNKGMFLQLAWAINQMSMGYYGWRIGTITDITFRDGSKLRLDPTLNAGTVAIMTLFSRLHSLNEWLHIMDQSSGFASFYQNMFGDSWARAETSGPIFPPGLVQPPMVLPFETHTAWVFTGGPHSAWEHDGPLAALDFAPSSEKTGCDPSTTWILSTAPGLVVRTGKGIVVVDLDGDGSEQTGWNILYLHVANQNRVAKGQWVETNDPIGHASCEGGISTGTHLHFARKYNGEWVTADGPIPFVLSGWTVIAGEKPYQGKMVKGNKVIVADVNGQARALIFRDDEGE
jgi:murein DD-endopeptidase MepM/ murein hydrolase activator NlpD